MVTLFSSRRGFACPFLAPPGPPQLSAPPPPLQYYVPFACHVLPFLEQNGCVCFVPTFFVLAFFLGIPGTITFHRSLAIPSITTIRFATTTIVTAISAGHGIGVRNIQIGGHGSRPAKQSSYILAVLSLSTPFFFAPCFYNSEPSLKRVTDLSQLSVTVRHGPSAGAAAT